VGKAMEADPLTVAPEELVSELALRLGTPGSPWHDVRLIPIIGPDRTLLGLITRADLFAALESAPHSTVLEAGIQRPMTLHAEATLADAADHMVRHGIGRIPVVDRSPKPKLVGLVTRRAILEAKRHQLELDRLPHHSSLTASPSSAARR
jgi:CBS domain-containing protein